MSSYENYTKTSKSYDLTRAAVGVEIITGCFAQTGRALADLTILDAGCGTGNYSQALLKHVGHIEAVDINTGMLASARAKLAVQENQNRIRFHHSSIDTLPFPDGHFDGVMINQVLHHLGDDSGQNYPKHRQVLTEFARVLKPGGVLTVNICSHEQLRAASWYYDLIPEALERCCQTHIPIPVLTDMLTECGFCYRHRYIPVDALLLGEAYFDKHGPLNPQWRDGDSIWALVTDAELARAQARIRELEAADALGDYITRNDEHRHSMGQMTFLFAVKNTGEEKLHG